MKKLPLLGCISGLALVAALSGCGGATDSVSPNSSLDNAPPSAPSGLDVGVGASGARALHWVSNAEPDLGSYQVYQYSPSPTRDNAYVLVATVAAGATEWALPAVDNDTDTFFKIRAVDQAGNRSAESTPYAVQLLPSGLSPDSPSDDPTPKHH